MPPKMKLSDAELHMVEALAAYITLEQTGDYLGYEPKEWTRLMRNKAVSIAYRKGYAKSVVAVAKGYVEKAIQGDGTAARFFLETRGGWSKNAPPKADDPYDGMKMAAPTIIEIVSADSSSNEGDSKKKKK